MFCPIIRIREDQSVGLLSASMSRGNEEAPGTREQGARIVKLLKTLFVMGVSAVALMMAVLATAAKQIIMPPAPDFDVKSYPGSACRQMLVEGDEQAFFWNCNDDPVSQILVSCPVVRDEVMGEDGYQLEVDVFRGVGGAADVYGHVMVGGLGD